MNKLSIFSMVLLTATLALLRYALQAAQRLVSRHNAQRADFFRRHPVQAGDIVFLGDSLTAGGNWHELFPGLPVKNRGINADTTLKVQDRLDDVLAGQPGSIFLLIGTNDLPWYMYRSDDAILRTYAEILQCCKDQSPHTRVFVQSIFPRHAMYAARIKRLNARLRALAGANGYVFIDVFPLLADHRGALRADLTNDNLHLMAEGYAIWAQVLQPFVSAK